MEVSVIQSILKFVNPFQLFNSLALLALPIWIIDNLKPDLLKYFRPSEYIAFFPKWISNVASFAFKVAIFLGNICLYGLMFLIITSVIRNGLGTVFSFFSIVPRLLFNDIREKNTGLIIRSFIYLSINLTAFALYAKILFNNPTYWEFLNNTHAWWFSILPTKVIIAFLISTDAKESFHPRICYKIELPKGFIL